MQSCRNSQPLTTRQTSDSVRIVERWRDSIIHVAPDTAWLSAWIECDSTGEVLLRELEMARGKNLTPTISIVNDTIYMECHTDSLELLLRARDRTITELQHSRTVETVEIEKQLTWWQVTQMKMGRLFMLVIAVLAVLMTIKRRLKL